MLLWEIIRVAFGALLVNKGRAVLTMLGIIIGVGAVIAMMAMGEGAQKAVQDRIAAMGVNQLRVMSDRRTTRGVSLSRPLTIDDGWALKDEMTLATAVMPEMSRGYQIKYGNKNIDSQVYGTVPEAFLVRRFKLASGQFFTEGDLSSSRRVAVLGANVAQSLDFLPQIVGENVRIGGLIFEVVGVMESMGGQSGWNNPDDQVFVPITTAQHGLMGTKYISAITVQVISQDWMLAASGEIERILRREHRLQLDQANDFRFFNQQELATTIAETSKVFGTLLASVAAVSLIVGGIGIMNIMLVSVTERTREIGIRKAIGAQRSVILLQFLLESVVLCLLGGFIGIGLGIGAAQMMARTGNWDMIVTPMSMMLAVGFSVAVGLFFGIYPASRAARMDPIEALRYE